MVKNIIAIILLIDAIAFLSWMISGQIPVDGFYLGAITANIIKFLIWIF